MNPARRRLTAHVGIHPTREVDDRGDTFIPKVMREVTVGHVLLKKLEPREFLLRERKQKKKRLLWAEAMKRGFVTDGFFDPRDTIQVKYEMLRRVHVDGEPISRVVKDHGYSRPTFYEVQEAMERDGLAGLLPRKRGPRTAHKLSVEVMEFVNDLLLEDRSLAAPKIAKLIRKCFKLRVHPRSIELTLARQKEGS